MPLRIQNPRVVLAQGTWSLKSPDWISEFFLFVVIYSLLVVVLVQNFWPFVLIFLILGTSWFSVLFYLKKRGMSIYWLGRLAEFALLVLVWPSNLVDWVSILLVAVLGLGLYLLLLYKWSIQFFLFPIFISVLVTISFLAPLLPTNHEFLFLPLSSKSIDLKLWKNLGTTIWENLGGKVLFFLPILVFRKPIYWAFFLLWLCIGFFSYDFPASVSYACLGFVLMLAPGQIFGQTFRLELLLLVGFLLFALLFRWIGVPMIFHLVLFFVSQAILRWLSFPRRGFS